mgnify:CR=1 FL=1
MIHLMNPLDFTVEELDQLFVLADDIEKTREKYAHACDGKKLATCFYEPSTRTRLSFESAMLNLGGSVIGFSDSGSSSASKGESVSDTIRVISCFADICAMRYLMPLAKQQLIPPFHIVKEHPVYPDALALFYEISSCYSAAQPGYELMLKSLLLSLIHI